MSPLLGINLSTIRKIRGLSQRQLSQLVYVEIGHLPDMSTISKHENGHRNPGVNLVVGYALALDVPTRFLYSGVPSDVDLESFTDD